VSRRDRNGRNSPGRETGIFDICRYRKLRYVSALLCMEAAQSPAQLLAYFAEFQAGSALPGNDAVIRRNE